MNKEYTMRSFWLTLAGFSLCLPLSAGAASFNVNGLDSILRDTSHDASVHGVVKAVNSPRNTFIVNVEKKGDVEFRVSPQTAFESEVLGGVMGRELGSGLDGLKSGDSVKVRYLTLPPETPVAAQVEVEH